MFNLEEYGYIETEAPPDGLLPARVTAIHRERFELITQGGQMPGKLKTSVYYGEKDETFPTVGDFVWVRAVEGGDGQIIKTLPRKSQFIRRDPNPNAGQQAVAANFDYVFIMTSLNRDFNPSRITRYLVLARQSGAIPVIILTKADLADSNAAVAAVQSIEGDVEIIPVSIVSSQGLDRLKAYLHPGKTVVFLGMSGVGKSSLLNTLMGQNVMAVKAIREDDSRGRHTTTHRQLFMLPSGAMVIDTPGMRTLGMWDATEGVGETFADVEELMGGCRFSDCRHQSEPGCAVLEAIASGRITEKRLENYQKLRREALYAEDKAAALREKWERNKSIARWSRKANKNKGIRR
ncbi:MAG: ribosome small subunit-dependent GTPase A [Oscillospiraceae bacterium]|nr:ribosome small subunit-dependent GTPase A [Oscillospiraceae bacterium]